jgi:predicted  nucleic acid-binding Zn-ribbon protein
MTLQERLAKANERSVALYLQRQRVEGQRQQLTLNAQSIEHELVKLDGVIESLEAQIAEDVAKPAKRQRKGVQPLAMVGG